VFNVQYHKVIIRAPPLLSEPRYCYIEDGRTLECNELVIEAGGRLYGPAEGEQVASSKIKSVKRPTVQGDWNFKQIADGIYESIDNIPTLPVTEGGTGLNVVEKAGILYGDGQNPLGVLSLGTRTQVLVVNDNEDGVEWGQPEHLQIQVRNDEGTTIPVGAPLYSKGEIGGSQRILVGIADAGDANKMPCIGLANAEMNTTTTKDNYATVGGVYNINLDSGFSGLNEGDILYVKNWSGTPTAPSDVLTTTKPTGPTELVQNVGIILKTNGTIIQGLLVSVIGRTNDVPNTISIEGDITSNGNISALDGTITANTFVGGYDTGDAIYRTFNPADHLKLQTYDAGTPGFVTELEILNDQGGIQITNDLTVGGDLTVSGTTTTLNTQTVEVEDNILQLNTTQGSPDTATDPVSGIEIYRGSGVNVASFKFLDNSSDRWQLYNGTAAMDFYMTGSISEMSANSNHLYLTTKRDGDDIHLRTGTTETTRMYIDGGQDYSGYVGIGTQTPASPLHVYHTDNTGIPGITIETAASAAQSDSKLRIKESHGSATWVDFTVNTFGQLEITGGATTRRQIFTADDPDTDDLGVISLNKDHYEWDTQIFGDSSTPVIFVDGTNNRMGVGLTNPSTELEIASTGTLKLGNAELVANQFRINNTGGYAQVELGGSLGAFIDLKSPFSTDDYDLRLISSGSGGTIQTSGNANLGINVGTGAVAITGNMSVSTGNVTVSSTLPLISLIDTDATNSPTVKIYNNNGNMSLRADSENVGTGGVIDFQTSGSEKMRLTDAGNLGIGTTSPDAPLHVEHSSGLIAKFGEGNVETQVTFADARAMIGYVGDSLMLQGGAGNKFVRFAVNNGTFGSGEVARFDTSGNFGLGITGPTAKLHVDEAGLNAASLTFDAAAGQIFTNENSQFAFGLHNASPYPLYIQGRTHTNGTRQMVLNPLGGNVGIGALDADDAPLHVKHTGNGDTLILESTDAAGTDNDMAPNLVLLRSGTPAQSTNTDAGKIQFKALDDGSTTRLLGHIQSEFNTASGSNGSARMRFNVSSSGGSGHNDYEYLRFDGGVRDVVFNESGIDIDVRIEGDSDTALFFTDASSDLIGIGTTSPAAKLDVRTGSGFAINIGADVNTTTLTDSTRKFARIGLPHYTNAEEPVTILTADSESSYSRISIGGGTGSGNAPSQIFFYAESNTTTLSNGSARAAITSTGLGIGTTSPSTELHVSGADHPSIRVTGTDNANADPAIELLGTDDSFVEGGQLWYDNSTGVLHLASLYNNAAADIQFHTRVGADRSTSNVRMTIEGDGNVGIGTSSPSSKLEVDGTITATAFSGEVQPKATTATAGAGTTDYYAKLLTFNPGGSTTRDCNLILGVTAHDQGAVGSAIISVKFRSNGTTAQYTADVAFMSKSGNSIFDKDAFQIFSDGNLVAQDNNTDIELWVKKNNNYGALEVHEISKAITGGTTTLTYHTDSAWQSSAPTNNAFTTTTQGIELNLDEVRMGVAGSDTYLYLHPNTPNSYLLATTAGDVTVLADDDLTLHADSDIFFQSGGANTRMTVASNGDVSVVGAFSAATKSFDIEHPTKEGMRLHHGSLEGPEHGVYVRGRLEGDVIDLPDYWLGLVDEDTITVQLTANRSFQQLYVDEIADNKIYVGTQTDTPIDCFYFVQAERKDVDKMEVEY
jgi:hypothetical protein